MSAEASTYSDVVDDLDTAPPPPPPPPAPAMEEEEEPAKTVTDTSAPTDLPKVPLSVAPTSSASVSGKVASDGLKNLIYWRDPKITGALFGLGNLFFFLTLVSRYTFLQLVSTAAFLGLSGAFAYVNVSKHAMGKTPTPNLAGSYIDRSLIERNLDDILFLINSGVDEVKKTVYCVDNVATLKIMGVFLVLYYVGRILPDMVLAYLVFLALFLGPTTYEKNQEKIDQYIDKLQAEAAVRLDKTRAMTMEHATKLRDQVVEKSTPLLEKNPKLREMAERAGLTPQKKRT